jgi:hypothetical protein
MKPAIWKNGRRTMRGRYEYHWASNRFVIELESRDRITGANRRMVIAGDKPEWGNWRLGRLEL